MKRFILFSIITVFAFTVSGCNPYNNAGEGAGIGGALGALAGGIIGHDSNNAAAGVLLGGALGAATGAAVGSTMQKPEPPPGEEVVVAQPVTTVSSTVPTVIYSGDTVTVNVPNSNGSYASVVLKRSANGYIGPQGEYYDQVPSIAQLQAMYGR